MTDYGKEFGLTQQAAGNRPAGIERQNLTAELACLRAERTGRQRAQRKPGSEDPASDQGRKSSGLLRRGDSGISGINEFPFAHQRRSRWYRRALRLNCTIRVEQEHQSGAARVERATGPDADAGTLEAWRWRAGWPHLRSPEGKIPGNASPAATSPSWPTPAGASSPPAPRSC